MAVRPVEGADPGTFAAAVADGHGGQRYVRSDIGSSIAVRVATDAGSELLGRAGSRSLGRSLAEELAPTIVERWNAEVMAHLAANPFRPEEHAAAGADLEIGPTISYGCTLILALVTPTEVALLQVGDGDAVVVSAEGTVSDPVPGDDRLVGGETTSLCLPDAAADARVAVLPARDVELVVLSSDGYGNSFASPQWRQESGIGFLDAVRADGLEGVGRRLPGWLADSARAGGDDVTMVVLHRPTGGGARASAARPGSRPSVLPLAVGAAVVALLVGAAVGWLVRGDGESDAAPSPTDVTATTGTTGTTGTDSLVAADPQLVSVALLDRVVTFHAACSNGVCVADEVRPRITLDGGPFTPTRPEYVKQFGPNNVTLAPLSGTGDRLIQLDRRAGAAREVDGVLWIVSENGEVMAVDPEVARGADTTGRSWELLTWQGVEQ